MWRNLDSSLATKAMKMARLIAAALLIGSMAAPALAIKTDVVVLFNGDHLTGEVKELVHGQLMFKTDDVGTLYIEWDKIASLTTLQLLQIELADGRRFFGTAPESASNPGSIRILIGPFGESPTPIELSIHDIVRMATVESGDAWYKRLDGSFSLGYSFTHANNLNVLNFSADIGSRDQVRKWKVAFDGQATSQANSPSSQRASQVSTWERFLPNRYYTEASLEFDRNEELGLYLRSLIGATFGRYLMQNKNSEFRAGAGLAASTEKSYDGTVGDNLEAQLTMRLNVFRYDYPKTNVSANLTVLPSLTESGRVRAEASVDARREFIADLFLQVSLYDSYDSRPADGSPNNDWGLTTSIGYSF